MPPELCLLNSASKRPSTASSSSSYDFVESLCVEELDLDGFFDCCMTDLVVEDNLNDFKMPAIRFLLGFATFFPEFDGDASWLLETPPDCLNDPNFDVL